MMNTDDHLRSEQVALYNEMFAAILPGYTTAKKRSFFRPRDDESFDETTIGRLLNRSPRWDIGIEWSPRNFAVGGMIDIEWAKDAKFPQLFFTLHLGPLDIRALRYATYRREGK